MTPLEQFGRWMSGADEPVSMALATASADGAPSVRMVLLKAADEAGFVFFTNYESRKGRELAENPRAASVRLRAAERIRAGAVTPPRTSGRTSRRTSGRTSGRVDRIGRAGGPEHGSPGGTTGGDAA